MSDRTKEQQKLLDEMKDKLGPEFVVFEPGVPIVISFLDWPIRDQFVTDEGARVECHNFDVIVDGEEKLLSVSSKRLLRILYPLLEENVLVGHTFEITAIGEGFSRRWTVKEVA